MNKKINLLKIVGVVAILAYLLTYGLAFTAFEYYEPYSYADWNYASYRINYISVMVCFGVSFTIALVSFIKLNTANKVNVCIINILCSVMQLGILFGVNLLAKEVIRFTDNRGDSVFGFHANVVVIMSYILMVINAVWILVALASYVFKSSDNSSQENEPEKVRANWSYIHLPAILVPVVSIAISNFYLQGMITVAITLLFMFFFVIPASILLVCVVRKWIEGGKYLFSICGYAIYGYLVYGAVYRWTKGIADAGFSVKDADNTFFESILGLLNVAVVVSVIVVLIINYVREKKCKK